LGKPQGPFSDECLSPPPIEIARHFIKKEYLGHLSNKSGQDIALLMAAHLEWTAKNGVFEICACDDKTMEEGTRNSLNKKKWPR